MKVLKLSALLLGAVLFLGFGATTLNAGMKCGAGKCGSAMMDAKKNCDDKKCLEGKDCKCGPNCDCDHKGMKAKNADGKCGAQKKAKKMGKCGDERAMPKKSMKCGVGKCG